jgi:sulfur carrier protein ThiS
MLLVINGEERNLAAPTLDALIEEMGMKGDRLEIVHFVGGGKT